MVKMEVTANTEHPIEEETAIGREEAKQVVRDMMKGKKQVQSRPFTANKQFVKEDFPSFSGQKAAPVQQKVTNEPIEAFPKFGEDSKLESPEKLLKPHKKP